jgi:hypothetical protein
MRPDVGERSLREEAMKVVLDSWWIVGFEMATTNTDTPLNAPGVGIVVQKKAKSNYRKYRSLRGRESSVGTKRK